MKQTLVAIHCTFDNASLNNGVNSDGSCILIIPKFDYYYPFTIHGNKWGGKQINCEYLIT